MPTATISLNQDNDVLTMDEAADMLKVTRRTVQNKIKRGEIRAYRASNRFVRLFRKDVNDFLKRYSTLPIDE